MLCFLQSNRRIRKAATIRSKILLKTIGTHFLSPPVIPLRMLIGGVFVGAASLTGLGFGMT